MFKELKKIMDKKTPGESTSIDIKIKGPNKILELKSTVAEMKTDYGGSTVLDSNWQERNE